MQVFSFSQSSTANAVTARSCDHNWGPLRLIRVFQINLSHQFLYQQVSFFNFTGSIQKRRTLAMEDAVEGSRLTFTTSGFINVHTKHDTRGFLRSALFGMWPSWQPRIEPAASYSSVQCHTHWAIVVSNSQATTYYSWSGLKLMKWNSMRRS